MTKKKYPLVSFCEWMVGTPIPAALGPIPKSSPIREIVTVAVLTDDETEEDTLRVTYPRASRKVRFKKGPTKSALKKPSASPASESAASNPAAKASAESSDSEDSAPQEPVAPGSGAQKTKKQAKKAKHDDASSEDDSSGTDQSSNKGKKPKVKQQTPDSEDDSEPDPFCKGSVCVRKRQERDRQAKKKCLKKNKKAGPAAAAAEAPKPDAKVEQDATTPVSKDEPQTSSAAEAATTSATNSENQKEEKPEGKTADSVPEDKPPQPAATAEATGSKPQEGEADKNKPDQKDDTVCPPAPPARPNLIEPVRTEMVHTEKVVESPEDPRPNAYYDAENKIIRLYYAPVYGQANHQPIWTNYGPPYQSLPMGMHHPPPPNPYYHSYDREPDKQGPPATQGVPMPPWPPYYTAPTFGGHSGYQPPWHTAAPAAEPNGNRGAFSRFAHASSSKDQDVAGANNIWPPGKPNSYIPKRSSPFSHFGSKKAISQGSPRRSDRGTGDAPQDSTTQPQQQTWGDSAQTAPGWGADATNNQTSQDTSGGNDGQINQTTDSWGNANVNNQATDSWGNANVNVTSSWDDAAKTGTDGNINNVMPGGWGDTSMAASTNGQVDKQHW